jgi:hypothetical protein
MKTVFHGEMDSHALELDHIPTRSGHRLCISSWVRKKALGLTESIVGSVLNANAFISPSIKAAAKAALIVVPALWYEIRFLITFFIREQL